MSAQSEAAQLRENSTLQSGGGTDVAEETAAQVSGAAVPAVPDPVQMNGVGGSGGEYGAGRREAGDPQPAVMATDSEEPCGSGVARPVGTEEAQRSKAIESQRFSSGATQVAEFSGDPTGQAAPDGAEVRPPTFFTPRSSRGAHSLGEGPRDPHTEWPGWFAKLGDMFKAPPVNWLPSPMPSPPRPRRLLEPRHLRGPPVPGQGGIGRVAGTRVEEQGSTFLGPNHPNHNTPSSSSVPAEAIQAEVQRQLGSFLDRLQSAEATNARLQEELSLARDQLRRPPIEDAARVSDPHHVPPSVNVHPRDPSTGAQDDGVSGGILGGFHGGNQRIPDERQPEGHVRQGLWSVPLGALWEELQGRRASEGATRVPVSQEVAQGSNQAKHSTSDSSTNAILEALTKNLVGLQELQLKTIRRDAEAEDSPEVVKNSAIVLPPLPAPTESATGIMFQDWIAQISVPMQDLSSSSASWWEAVMSLVQTTYSRWLADTPLERLQIEPLGH